MIHLINEQHEYWVPPERILWIETPGQNARPNGWVDGCAAWVMLGENSGIALDAEQWRQLRKELKIGEYIP